MAAPSNTDNKACLEMWRNAGPVTWQQRAAENIVKREQFENQRVQEQIEATERSLARLQLAAGLQCTENDKGDYEVSIISQESASTVEAVWGKNVSFSNGDHPEYRNPIRPGTPFVQLINSNGNLTDDEWETPRVSRTETRSSVSSKVSSPILTPTPELLQSPVPSLRSLNPSEVWDDEAPVGPILYHPVPLRPLIKPEMLLVGYQEPRPESPTARINAFHDELKKLVDNVETLSRLLGTLSKDA